MADFTNTLEERVLDWAFTTGSPTRPTNWYVGLFEVTPTADDGTGGTECTGTGYARQSVTWTRSAQTMNPSATVTFGPASGAWSTVNGFGIWDSLTSGVLLAFEDLTTPRTLGDGDSAEFATADLSITLD
jgi:hypothetical protein